MFELFLLETGGAALYQECESCRMITVSAEVINSRVGFRADPAFIVEIPRRNNLLRIYASSVPSAAIIVEKAVVFLSENIGRKYV